MVSAWQRTDAQMSIHGWIALGLGVFFSIVIGCGLMALMFYSSRAGLRRSDEADRTRQESSRGATRAALCFRGAIPSTASAGKWRTTAPRKRRKGSGWQLHLPLHRSLTVSRSTIKMAPMVAVCLSLNLADAADLENHRLQRQALPSILQRYPHRSLELRSQNQQITMRRRANPAIKTAHRLSFFRTPDERGCGRKSSGCVARENCPTRSQGAAIGCRRIQSRAKEW